LLQSTPENTIITLTERQQIADRIFKNPIRTVEKAGIEIPVYKYSRELAQQVCKSGLRKEQMDDDVFYKKFLEANSDYLQQQFDWNEPDRPYCSNAESSWRNIASSNYLQTVTRTRLPIITANLTTLVISEAELIYKGQEKIVMDEDKVKIIKGGVTGEPTGIYIHTLNDFLIANLVSPPVVGLMETRQGLLVPIFDLRRNKEIYIKPYFCIQQRPADLSFDVLESLLEL